MCSVNVSVFFGLLTAIGFVLGVATHTGHHHNGQLIDNLHQFPHHVFIVVPESGQKCGGSVLNRRWVLTSAFCVKEGIQLDLYFRKKPELDDNDDFFAVSVDKDQVFVYPTNYDDIALVKVPISLDYSEVLAPMNVSKLSIEALRGRYTVMPALGDFVLEESTTIVDELTTTTDNGTTPGNATTPFILPTPRSAAITRGDYEVLKDEDEDHPKYGMYNVLENRICKQVYGVAFDEYTQLCIESWGNSTNRPCDSDFGSGLIVGWPAKGELAGLFHMDSATCVNRQPTVFTFTGKYLPWIDSLISGDN